jgi:hypothetical protein
MHHRCYQKTHEAYERYSDRGITVCAEWHEYTPFMNWALENGYGESLELDRRENTKGYAPGNCRWVTTSINARNRRDSLPAVLAFGDTKTPIEWSKDPRCMVSYALLHKRLARGVPLEVALSTPSRDRRGRGEETREQKTQHSRGASHDDPR